MVAERDRVGAGVHHLAVDRLRDAEAAGRVLAVDDDAIEFPVTPKAGQPVEHDRTSRTSHHVANKKKPHASSVPIPRLVRPRSTLCHLVYATVAFGPVASAQIHDPALG